MGENAVKNPIDALERAVRKAEECLGTDIFIRRDGDGAPIHLEAYDDDLRGRRFTSEKLGPPSKWAQQAKAFHEEIYRARGQEAFRRQNGLCALCGKKMQGTANTEIDHKKSRGAHGRDDRLENLRAVHSSCHRLRHNPPPNMKGQLQ